MFFFYFFLKFFASFGITLGRQYLPNFKLFFCLPLSKLVNYPVFSKRKEKLRSIFGNTECTSKKFVNLF